ncbi:MAG: hypothetical protein ACERKK_04075 [Poseidonibacter sp.]|uniref:hypothetical protein n=1 Tax=Poseidonibacter sp. TaxID=2321188 RepID=UPI00359D31C1
MRKIITVSWVLVSKLKTHDNLFLLDNVANEYLVRVYLCKCEHDEIVTGDYINNNYICTSCNNDIFFDANDIYPGMESFVENTYYNRRIKLNFNMTFDVDVYKNKIHAVAKIKIPTKINFLRRKIIKEDTVVVGIPFQERIKNIVRSPFSSVL